MKTGTSTGGIEMSNRARTRAAKRRRAQEREWVSKNGPVILRQATPEELERSTRARQA